MVHPSFPPHPRAACIEWYRYDESWAPSPQFGTILKDHPNSRLQYKQLSDLGHIIWQPLRYEKDLPWEDSVKSLWEATIGHSKCKALELIFQKASSDSWWLGTASDPVARIPKHIEPRVIGMGRKNAPVDHWEWCNHDLPYFYPCTPGPLDPNYWGHALCNDCWFTVYPGGWCSLLRRHFPKLVLPLYLQQAISFLC